MSPRDFWSDHTSVSTALKEVEGLRSRLVDHIKSEPLAVGTGFLVGRDHILTNNHVLPNTEHAEEYIIRFRFEVDLQGRELDFVDYALDSSFFYTNEADLDYTLAKLSPLSKATQKQQDLPFLEAGNNFGWLQMLRTEDGAVAIPYIPTIESIQYFRQLLEQVGILRSNLNTDLGIPGEFDSSPLAYENQWARNLRVDSDFGDGLEPDVRTWLKRRGINGQSVSLIQHPKGARKEVVLNGNQVQAIYPNWIQYQTDAEPGSSGSPLFNTQWQLVGLHHSVLISSPDKVVASDNEWFKPFMPLMPSPLREWLQSESQYPQEVKVVGYLGTRICRIVDDLDAQQKDQGSEALKAFLSDYVDHPKRGRIFISAGRKRNLTADLEAKATFESEVLLNLGSKIVEAIRAEDATLEAVHIQAQKPAFGLDRAEVSFTEEVDVAIAWLENQEAYRPGDVAIEILLDTASERAIAAYADLEQSAQALAPEEVRGAKVCYLWNQAERKFNAELLLREFWQSAQKVNKAKHGDESEFPNLGAQPDITLGRLKFCAEVSMPSLVLYAGYLTSEKDCQLFKEDESLKELANGIAQGLIKWTNALSPNMF